MKLNIEPLTWLKISRSKVRLRIIKLLSTNKKMHQKEFSRQTGLDERTIKNEILKLCNLNILIAEKEERIINYSINPALIHTQNGIYL